VLALQFAMHAGPIRLSDPPMASFAAPAGVERRLKRAVMPSGRGQDRPAPSIRFNVSRLAFVRSFRLNWQPGGLAMTANLEILIEAARKVRPSPDQEEEQRRSFAYGNTAFENSLIAFSTELRSSGGAEPCDARLDPRS
jgi:hypothetical protein